MKEKILILREKGKEIFKHLASRLTPGVSEKEYYDFIIKTLIEQGVEKNWHPVVVKFDESTFKEGVKHIPSSEIIYNHVAVLDVGFVLDGIELDFGETFTNDSNYFSLVEASKKIASEGIKLIKSHDGDIPPNEVYTFLCKKAETYGFGMIAQNAGHRIGQYPTPKSEIKIRKNDPAERFCGGGWMIEVHIGDGRFGAFFEDYFYL